MQLIIRSPFPLTQVSISLHSGLIPEELSEDKNLWGQLQFQGYQTKFQLLDNPCWLAPTCTLVLEMYFLNINSRSVTCNHSWAIKAPSAGQYSTSVSLNRLLNAAITRNQVKFTYKRYRINNIENKLGLIIRHSLQEFHFQNFSLNFLQNLQHFYLFLLKHKLLISTCVLKFYSKSLKYVEKSLF